MTSTGDCNNGIFDIGESSVDCGGQCKKCPGESCENNDECSSGNCHISLVPQPGGEVLEETFCTNPTCFDKIKNQGEIETDCGGPCKKCPGESCENNDECSYDICTLDNKCANMPAICSNEKFD